jgi:hypothetical protein
MSARSTTSSPGNASPSYDAPTNVEDSPDKRMPGGAARATRIRSLARARDWPIRGTRSGGLVDVTQDLAGLQRILHA